MDRYAVDALTLLLCAVTAFVVARWVVSAHQRADAKAKAPTPPTARAAGGVGGVAKAELAEVLVEPPRDPTWEATWGTFPEPGRGGRKLLEAEARNIQLTEQLRTDRASEKTLLVQTAHRRLVQENEDIVRTGVVPPTQEEALGVVSWHLLARLLDLTIDDEALLKTPMDVWWARDHRSIVLVSDLVPNGVDVVTWHEMFAGAQAYKVIALGRKDLKRALAGDLDIPDDFGNLWVRIHESS